jgi:RNA polymerase sigma-70 factor (ECF subfamily)
MTSPARGYLLKVLRRPRGALRLVASESPVTSVPPGDAEILEAFARGDPKSAGLVYERLVGVVDGTLYRVIGRREADHDDLIQSTFEQIILTLSKQRFAGGCSLRGWAASIAGHIGLNAIRSRTRARRVFDPAAEAQVEAFGRRSHDDVEAQVSARREIERVRLCLAEMDRDRAITVLNHDVFGLSLAETARLTGASMTAAQSRLVRGRRDLKDRMKERDER